MWPAQSVEVPLPAWRGIQVVLDVGGVTMVKIRDGEGVLIAMERMVDVTDDVEEYEKGKTFECECGQGFGVSYGTDSVVCPSCDKVVVDSNAGDREPPEREGGQTSLGEWS